MIPLLEPGIAHQVNTGADSVPIAAMSYQAETEPMIVTGRGIAKKLRPAIEPRHDHVHAAIPVKISKRRAAVLSHLLKTGTGFGGNIGEGAVSPVQEQQVSLPGAAA